MNARLVEAARRYIGTPFRHQGRDANGLDCAGLVLLALNDIGEFPDDVDGYGLSPWRGGLRDAVEAFYGPPIDDAPEPGDVLLMRFRAEPQHLAIATDYYLGGLGIIHTRSDLRRGQQRGQVVEHRLNDVWAKRIVKVYR